MINRKLRSNDLTRIENALLRICQQRGITVIDMSRELGMDDTIPSLFLDNSASYGDDVIVLGVHLDIEVRVLSLAHEVGHIMAFNFKGIEGEPMDVECAAWLWAIRFLRRRFPQLKFKADSIERCVQMLRSYETAPSFEGRDSRDRRVPIQMWKQFGRLG